MNHPKSIKIDNVTYVPEAEAAKAAIGADGLPATLVRAYSGVFFGYMISRENGVVRLKMARQIYYWDSAGLKEKSNTCPDIASNGVGTGSKISSPAAEAIIEQVGAVFFVTDLAEKTINSQGWSKK